MRASTCAAVLLVAVAAVAAAAAGDGDDGSWTPIESVRTPHIQQFGQWVAEELGAPMRFYGVVSGKRQSASGINYLFTVAMGNREGVVDNYKVEVHVTVEYARGQQLPAAAAGEPNQ